jgi:protein-disulfide isomerase
VIGRIRVLPGVWSGGAPGGCQHRRDIDRRQEPVMPASTSSTARERREQAREQAAALRRAQVAAERRRRVVSISALGLALVALVVVVVVTLSQRTDLGTAEDVPLAEVTSAPEVALADGGIPVGVAGVGDLDPDLPRVDVYADYMCPGCASFEQINGETLVALAAEGTATVVYHPVAILDSVSQGSRYSTRAASAVALVAEQAPEHLERLSLALFTAQYSTGLTDEEIAGIARDAGVPDEVAVLIAEGTAAERYAQWVTSATRDAVTQPSLTNPERDGFTTPTIALDGVRWGENWSDPAALTAAVDALPSKG